MLYYIIDDVDEVSKCPLGPPTAGARAALWHATMSHAEGNGTDMNVLVAAHV